jgi:peptidoglycan/xylan/chitin deacetylase (PgdA/CDA1 family)
MVFLGAGMFTAAAQAACRHPNALGVARNADIDARDGAVYGSVTKLAARELLQPGEVVLTFDDGPLPVVTPRILAALDRHCTKATFFVVGRMAREHPEILRATLAAGHSVGTHTWSHPAYVRQMTHEMLVREIDLGISAAEEAAGRRLAPFFRFPGLGDTPRAVAHLRSRGIATFTVDVISNDSFISDPHALLKRTLDLIEKRGRGILLFHDIKPVTADALPSLLDELERRRYRIVHLRPAPMQAPALAEPAMRSPSGAAISAWPGLR